MVKATVTIAALFAILAAPYANAGFPGRALPQPASDTDFHDNGESDPAKVALGAQLFYDKVLSGRA